MKFMRKQLGRQLYKNRTFLVLLYLLMVLDSVSFFFVRFSIDGNMAKLNGLPVLNESQQLYKNALHSNTALSYISFAALSGLVVFVIIMFFYRFFRSHASMMGCLKDLGFRDLELQKIFTIFTAILSAAGSLSGLFFGYFLSGILTSANQRTYGVSGLVRDIHLSSLLTGILLPTAIFSAAAFFCYAYIRRREIGSLITCRQDAKAFTRSMAFAKRTTDILPVKNKSSLRIALQKPAAVFVILVAVMSFQACLLLAYSLNKSSRKVYDMQTIGHNYEFEAHYPDYRMDTPAGQAMAVLTYPSEVTAGKYHVEQELTGLYKTSQLLELKKEGRQAILHDSKTNLIPLPEKGTVFINPGLAGLYNVSAGDVLTIHIAGKDYPFVVGFTAYNAKPTAIYMNASELCELLDIPYGAYNGLYSMSPPPAGGTITTREQRMEDLKRNSVSNQVSGVINQVIGCVIGIILLFLAIYINVRDNTHDILILYMFGFRLKEIRKLFVDIYRPVVWTMFFLTLIPSIWLVQTIQRIQSIATGDYMPFGTGIGVIALTFAILEIICRSVQWMFSAGINHIIKTETCLKYTAD